MEQLKEVKASRDVAVHNQGIVGDDYVAKCGNLSRFRPGDRLKLSETYLRDVHGVIRNTIEQMASAAASKLRN